MRNLVASGLHFRARPWTIRAKTLAQTGISDAIVTRRGAVTTKRASSDYVPLDDTITHG
jgi:hypothetical protein